MQELANRDARERDADTTRQGAFVAKPQTAHVTAPLGFLPVSFLWQDPETGAVGEAIHVRPETVRSLLFMNVRGS